MTLACANLFIGIITTVTTFVLENFNDEELKNIGNICKKVCTLCVVYLYPNRDVLINLFFHYCLGLGFMETTHSGKANLTDKITDLEQ